MYIIDGAVAKRVQYNLKRDSMYVCVVLLTGCYYFGGQKWKQDGWTYLPRKQGIGFREDNENLRIGGENVRT